MKKEIKDKVTLAQKAKINWREIGIKQRIKYLEKLYQLFIDKDTGPRLQTFFMALGKEKIEGLLKF